MLDKETCYKCVLAEHTTNKPYPAMPDFTRASFEEMWKDCKTVWCCNGGKQMKWFKIENEPPVNCPYALEQLMSQQCRRHSQVKNHVK